MNNYSKQREEILDVLKDSYNHPTAEEVYLKMKEKHSTASRGTVYRNLNVLTKNNVILKISILGRPDRYDFLRKEHSHVICTECGKVSDFQYKFDKMQLENQIKGQTNINPCLETISIYGICDNCK